MRADHAGTEIVQYGAAYSCCSPALLVSRIDRAGLRAQIELPEFEVRELGGDTAGVSFLTGAPCLAEMVGEAVSYQPWIVIRLVAPFGIDSVASEARTRQAAGGYAGLGCRDDVDVIRENGRPKLRVRVEARRR